MPLVGQKAMAKSMPSSRAPQPPRCASPSPLPPPAERWKPQPPAEEHVEADEQQDGAEQPFSVSGNELLDAEQAGSLAQHGDQQDAQCGVGDDPAEGIEHAVEENAAPVVQVPADEADGRDVGGQRAGRNGREQTQYESGQRGGRPRCSAATVTIPWGAEV